MLRFNADSSCGVYRGFLIVKGWFRIFISDFRPGKRIYWQSASNSLAVGIDSPVGRHRIRWQPASILLAAGIDSDLLAGSLHRMRFRLSRLSRYQNTNLIEIV